MTEPTRAVFLSYASQDSEATQRICEALRAAGIEVWFDQSELRGGDAWDHHIRHQIADCALFVPIISAHTQARPEGYFRLEWDLADQRSHMIARSKAFIIPVCVDDTPDRGAEVPESFLKVQWTRLPDGATPTAFAERVTRLLSSEAAHAPPDARSPTAAAPHTATAPRQPAASPPASRQTQRVLLLIAAVAIIAVGYIAVDKLWLSKHATAGTQRSIGPAGSSAPTAIPERSIAVLPFADMSEKKDQEYFSDGLSEELIDMLTKVPDLRVPARTSSFYFKGQHVTISEIAKALGVSHLLEGSVRRAGNTIRVTAQLIRADNGYHLWSETFDRDAKDIFKVQDEIAARVVDELKVALPGSPPRRAGRTGNTAAYNLYLLGQKFLDESTREGFENAVEEFKRAVALDPDYATAYSRLALAEASLADVTDHATGLQGATAAAERAIALAPDSADGYYARAYLRTIWLWDWDGASADFDKALTLDPNSADILNGYGIMLGAKGQLRDAIAAMDKAIRIDPLRASLEADRGRLAVLARDLPAARVAFHRVRQIDPNNERANVELAMVELLDHRLDRAAAALREPARPNLNWRLIGAALVEYSLGNTQESQKALDTLIKASGRFAAFQIAEIYAWRGEKDQAFQWLDHAYAQRDGGLTRVKNDPLLDSVRTDPRYKAFLRKMKLPE